MSLLVFACFSLFHCTWNISALLLSDHFFTHANRKDVCFLPGCSFAVLELLGVGFSFCYYCWFPFRLLLYSNNQFLRSCAPFYSSEDQKYLGENLKNNKKKSLARKGLLMCLLLLIPTISLLHAHVYKSTKSHCCQSVFLLDSLWMETGLRPWPQRG